MSSRLEIISIVMWFVVTLHHVLNSHYKSFIDLILLNENEVLFIVKLSN